MNITNSKDGLNIARYPVRWSQASCLIYYAGLALSIWAWRLCARRPSGILPLISMEAALKSGVGRKEVDVRESAGIVIIAALLSLASPALSPGTPSAAPGLPLMDTKIVVRKSRRLLELYSGSKLLRTFRVGLGFNPLGDKRVQGDGRTPEGEFYVCVKNPRSKFYLSLGLSYPGREAAEHGLREGLITRSQHNSIMRALRQKRMPLQNTRLGGEIYIHGSGSGSDWTLGCVALDDRDMKELYEAVEVGASVRIEP
jgi:hypothetical protein